jgi:hypothetical protein
MKRRQWLRGALATPALAAATAAAPPAAAQTPPPSNQDSPKLTLSTADAVADGTKGFFTPDEFATLEALCKAILPAFNGRPGAVESDVPRFLDFLLYQSPSPRQTLYRTGLARLAEQNFAKLDAAGAKKVLAALEQPWTYAGPTDPLAQFLRAAKDDILQATVNSREWSASSRSRTGAGTSYYYFPIE